MNNAFYETLQTVTFAAAAQGPCLLVFGAIHGNEVCGTEAIRRVIARLEKGELTLACGTVVFVPVCNPKAYALGQRFAEKNLNRVICHHSAPSCYEERLAGQLVELISSCDALLDLHSFHGKGPAFVFQDVKTPETEALTRCLGVPSIVTGWPELYETSESSGLSEGDTAGYAASCGKPAVVLECGYHADPAAVLVAERGILNALAHLGLIRAEGAAALPAVSPTFVRVKKIVVKGEDVGHLAKDWAHLDPVRAGDVLALYEKGGSEIAPYDGFILLPKADALCGEEWFYLGQSEEIA